VSKPSRPVTLERRRRRLRPDQDEQLAVSGLLASVRSQEQRERGRVEERHCAQVDHDTAPPGGRLGGLFERIHDCRGPVHVQLAGEGEDGRSARAARQRELEVRRLWKRNAHHV
jgi:hypothetical protein